MKTKQSKPLCEKIFPGRQILSMYHHNKPMLLSKDVKKHIQEFLKEVKEEIKEGSDEEISCWLNEKLNNLSKKHFGRSLVE